MIERYQPIFAQDRTYTYWKVWDNRADDYVRDADHCPVEFPTLERAESEINSYRVRRTWPRDMDY